MGTTMLLPEIARQWRMARRLYPVYGALRKTFGIDIAPCAELEQTVDRSEPEALARVWGWFDEMDDRIQVHQLRQLLQGTELATPENISALIRRHLDRAKRNSADRDKVDFLLVQYFAHRAPQDVKEEDVTVEHVLETLLPILGDVPLVMPSWAPQLDKALDALTQCQSLPDLLHRGILEEARWLKEGVGTAYFQPISLVLFTRFNYRVRLVFFRLMHGDLQAIRVGLDQLERKGVKAIDCRQANLSAAEPLRNLQMISTEWKSAFRAAYSAGQNFRQILAIRAAVDRALAQYSAGLLARADAANISEVNHLVNAARAEREVLLGEVPAEHSAMFAARAEREVAATTVAAEPWANLEGCVRDISAQLKNQPEPGIYTNLPFTVVALPGGTTLGLAAWEYAAFTDGDTPLAGTLRRAIAATALIKDASTRRTGSQGMDMTGALQVAEAEMQAITAALAKAKTSAPAVDVISLAATGRRLHDRCRAAKGESEDSPSRGKGSERKTRNSSGENPSTPSAK